MAEELANHATRAILILSLTNPEDLASISSPISIATARTQTRLLIVIFCPALNNVSRIASWDAVQRLLTHVYMRATTVSQEQNKILMNVDVLLRAFQGPEVEPLLDHWDTIFYTGGTEGLPIPHSWSSLPSVHLLHDAPSTLNRTQSASHAFESGPAGYPVVVLGGTFDHLHAGHKILLSMSAWIAQEKIIVGVTDDALLVNKKHRELLESMSVRMESVRNFLRLFRPGITYDIVPLTDVYGPTRWDHNIQALVVSKETLDGADSIASFRAKNNLPALKTFVIDVISSSSIILGTEDPSMLKNAKLSSTFIRQWIHDQNVISSRQEIRHSSDGI